MSKLIEFFKYDHLPEDLQKVSQPYYHLAMHLSGSLPENAETTTALRKLLESKDCAVRSALTNREILDA